MNEPYHKRLNADLGFEFDLFAIEHPEWMVEHVPAGATVVLQTDDAGFNAWAREIAERNREKDPIPSPIVLIHIRELLPIHSRIVRAEAELVTTNH